MFIPLTEPTSPRYIYVNPANNKVHIMMPVVSVSVGETGISLDNTCKSVYALKEFFGKSQRPQQVMVQNELLHYKTALEFDISLLMDMPTLKQQKQERLAQINQYIELIKTIQSNAVLNTLDNQLPSYPEPLQTIMRERNTNLYSMVLRPTVQDSYLRPVNPVFSVKRMNDSRGNPNSLFYQALHDVYQRIALIPKDARARLTAAVIASTEGLSINFKGIQHALSQKARELLGVHADFTKFDKDYTKINLENVTQDYVDEQMGFHDNPATAEEYVDALINFCVPTLFDTLLESPFYTIKTAEELSILTQFFLATANVYCRAENLSPANFGQVLDASEELSTEVAARVFSALLSNANIEESLLDFVNGHQGDLKLKRVLTLEDIAAIKKQFTEHYAQIKDSPHFDEFMVLDSSKTGKFVTHQGCICTDFCEFLAAAKQNSFFVQQKRKDFATMNDVIPHKNDWIAGPIELDIEELPDEQLVVLLEKLPQESRKEIKQSYPERMAQIARLQLIKILPDFLLHVARGQQTQAERLLTESPDKQLLLLTPETFTDYSGRTYQCTAYEKAYWDKDTRMCRMLESHMDGATKAEMSARIEAMERDGLVYQQQGQEHRSAHFDLTPLKTALQEYIAGYDNWDRTRNWVAMNAAWMKVGIAQRDVPAHVAHEYCMLDRSFDPCPSFIVNEESLPRTLQFYNYETGDDESWYPPAVAPNSGLGFDFAITRGLGVGARGGAGEGGGFWGG